MRSSPIWFFSLFFVRMISRRGKKRASHPSSSSWASSSNVSSSSLMIAVFCSVLMSGVLGDHRLAALKAASAGPDARLFRIYFGSSSKPRTSLLHSSLFRFNKSSSLGSPSMVLWRFSATRSICTFTPRFAKSVLRRH